MIKDDNFCYKGIYYCLKDGVWYLFDDYEVGYLFTFNVDSYRLDECFKYVEDKAFSWAETTLKFHEIEIKTNMKKEFIDMILFGNYKNKI